MIADEPLRLLPAGPADLPVIMALERTGFAAPEQWSEQSWLGQLVGDGRTTVLARRPGAAGVVALQTTGPVAELHRLVVGPDHRRQGVGLALLEAGLQAVRRAGAQSVLLEVGYTNEAAIALYQRVGFEQLAVRPDYYGPGRSALILKLYDLARWSAL